MSGRESFGERASTQTVEDAREIQRAPRMRHFAHPTDRTRAWCGLLRPDPNKPWVWGRVGLPECVVCVDLYRTFGMDGWLRGEPTTDGRL